MFDGEDSAGGLGPQGAGHDGGGGGQPTGFGDGDGTPGRLVGHANGVGPGGRAGNVDGGKVSTHGYQAGDQGGEHRDQGAGGNGGFDGDGTIIVPQHGG